MKSEIGRKMKSEKNQERSPKSKRAARYTIEPPTLPVYVPTHPLPNAAHWYGLGNAIVYLDFECFCEL